MLFFDIETFSEKENEFKPDGTKVITIQFNDGENITVLKEWDSDEKDILEKFYRYLKKFSYMPVMVGHNVLRFDVPILIHRMAMNNIDSMSNLTHFFHNIFVIDCMQCMLPFNNFMFKGLNAVNLSEKLNLSKPVHSNRDIDGFYRRKEFGKIEEHAISDIKFVRDLWNALMENQITQNNLK